MSKESVFAENGAIHKIAMDIDRVINSLQYAEADASYKPACLILVCINQLKINLSTLNNEFGHDWPENK